MSVPAHLKGQKVKTDTSVYVYRTGTREGAPVVEMTEWALSTDADGGVALPCELESGHVWKLVGGSDLWVDMTPFRVPPTIDGFGRVLDAGSTTLPSDYFGISTPDVVHVSSGVWYGMYNNWRREHDNELPELRPNPSTLIVEPECLEV